MHAAAPRFLTPEILVHGFGLKARRAQQAICAFHRALQGAKKHLVVGQFERWKVFYGAASDERAWARRLESRDRFRRFTGTLGLPPRLEASQVLFAVHTYYALVVKLIAVLSVRKLDGFATPKLSLALAGLEQGDPFRKSGVRNFLEGDFFGWYLLAWNRDLEMAAADLIRSLSEYDLPENPGDLLKQLYLNLVPKEVRHDLGEYYTPDWLAEELLAATLGESGLGNPAVRVLDPACGSGSFLVLLINHIKASRMEKARALDLILQNVIGFDLNPLAVMAARTNYLLALGDWLHTAPTEIEIPVYLADAILTPDPRFAGSCHYVVGNPPWVNWEHLPESYRRATRPLWEHYGLFPKRAKGMDTILGAAKYDLSMLMTYVAADRYLQKDGKLGFVLSQTLFKSAAAGQGFRRFMLPDGTPLAPCVAEDLVQLKAFDGAANRTATLVLQKGRAIKYPIDYRFYNRQARASYCWRAQPVSATDATSSWISARPAALDAITRILGASPYRAREGANTGGANAVFWVEIAAARAEGGFTVRNVTKGARTPVPATRAGVEASLVYPLLRGKDVTRWSAIPAHSILLTHQPGMRLRAIPEARMAKTFPKAWLYLKRFRGLLQKRPAFKRYFKEHSPFYSLFNLGDYTFAPWKVVWREQALPFTAAVVGAVAGKIVIPDHKLMLVPFESEEESHYVCGVLNSLPVNAAVAAYAIEIQIATHVLDHVQVPRFSRKNPVHRRVASGSRKAHAAVRAADPLRLAEAEADIDHWAARLWGLSEADLRHMREFLREAGL